MSHCIMTRSRSAFGKAEKAWILAGRDEYLKAACANDIPNHVFGLLQKLKDRRMTDTSITEESLDNDDDDEVEVDDENTKKARANGWWGDPLYRVSNYYRIYSVLTGDTEVV
jgi:hypothetical protein